MIRVHRLASVVLSGIVLSMFITVANPVLASPCPSSKIGGKPVGWIEFDGIKVPLKSVNAPAGGELDPPATAEAGGVSRQHQPLLAAEGTTVIAWHVRFGMGCNGSLNPLLAKSTGSTFDIVTAQGQRQTYTLTTKVTVPRGKYRPEWFRSNGSPQMALFTCADPQGGKYQKTTALFAEPI
jgi:hypothetical protein